MTFDLLCAVFQGADHAELRLILDKQLVPSLSHLDKELSLDQGIDAQSHLMLQSAVSGVWDLNKQVVSFQECRGLAEVGGVMLPFPDQTLMILFGEALCL